MPLALDAAILSRMRSAVTSRSNWANDSSMLSVSRPMLVVVLNDWVTETKLTCRLVEGLDQLGEVEQRAGQPVDLVDDDDVDAAVPRYRRAAAAVRAARACRQRCRHHRSASGQSTQPSLAWLRM